MDLLIKEIRNIIIVIKNHLDEEVLSEFMNTKKSKLCKYHFGMGLWIRNMLLYPNKNLMRLFIENGIKEPDEMSELIILLLHSDCKINCPPD